MKNFKESVRKSNGFTLIELMIIIIVVSILSVVAVSVYKQYVKRAMLSEARALMATVLTAQKTYYAEYSYFYQRNSSWSDWTSNDPILGIDAQGNKYFTLFTPSNSAGSSRLAFTAYSPVPKEAIYNGKNWVRMEYNITAGLVKDESSSSYEQI